VPKNLSRRRIALYAVVAVLALTALNNLGGTLAKMHLPGREAGDINAIASPSSDKDTAEELVQSWADWDSDREGDREKNNSAPPGSIVGAWLIIDSLLLAPALAMFLQRMAWRRRRLLVRSDRLQAVLSVTVWVAIAYLFVDELENVLTGVFIFYDLWLGLNWISLAKWILLAGAAVGVSASFVPQLREPRERSQPLSETPPAVIPTVRALRMPLVCVALAVLTMTLLPGSVRPQLQDVVRTWIPGDRREMGIVAVVALVIFTMSLWAATALIRCRAGTQLRSTPLNARRYAFYCALAFVVGGLAALSYWTADVGVRAASVVSIGLFAYIGLSLLWGPRAAQQPRGQPSPSDPRSLQWPPPNYKWNPNVARAVVAIPGLAFAVMVLSAVDLARPGSAAVVGALFAVGGMAVAAGGWALGNRKLPSLRHPLALAAWGLLILAVVTGLLLAVFTYVTPVTTGNDFGSVTLLLAGVTAFLGIAVLAEQLFWGPPRGFFARLRLSRAPLLALLVGVFALTSFFDESVDFHEARTLHPHTISKTRKPADAATLNVKTLLDQYKLSMPAANPRVLPVFVVAAEGGGGRAAYWTTDVLNCLFGGAPPKELKDTQYASPACAKPSPDWNAAFAASGISGGSVGLAMYTSESKRRHGVLDTDAMFDDGFLDPTMANLLYIDAPNSILRTDTWPDRAEALELAFEDVAPGLTKGLFATQLTHPPPGSDAGALPKFPILMLNSASVEDGCRINVAVVRLAEAAPVANQGNPDPTKGEPVDQSCTSLTRIETPPPASGASNGPATSDQEVGALSATRDVADYVCAHNGVDIPLSTAALLSARFPFVSPTGALQWCGPDKDIRTFAVDGGYIDSSGASPLVGLLERLTAYSAADPDAPCIQPVVLQVDNGYAGLSKPSAGGRPREPTAPLTGRSSAAGVQSGASSQALGQLATGHRCPVPDGLPQDHPLRSLPSYLHVYPRAHPGTEAPLGWSLSADARLDLDKQLASAENQCALANAKAWLVGVVTDMPSCTAFTPTADCVRITANADSGSAVQPVNCPDTPPDTSGPPDKPMLPRANATYKVCSGGLDDCAQQSNGPRCSVPIDADRPCHIKTDFAGAIRFITRRPLAQQSEFSLVSIKNPGQTTGLSDAPGRHWLLAGLLLIALAMVSWVLTDALRLQRASASE
jgi:hypothetical protein